MINNISGNAKVNSGWPPQAPVQILQDFVMPAAIAVATDVAPAPSGGDAAAALAAAAADASPAKAIAADIAALPVLAAASTPAPRGGKLPAVTARETAAPSAACDAWLALIANLLPLAPPAPAMTVPPSTATAAPDAAVPVPTLAPATPAAAAAGAAGVEAAAVCAVLAPEREASRAAPNAEGDAGLRNFAGWIQQANTPTTAASATPLQATPTIPVPVNHSGWGEALGHHVVWSLGQGVQQVQIQLHPEELGPISVHLRLQQDQAQIAFTAAHVQTREAIEQALPRLRELLGQEGISLSQASVQSQASQQDAGRGGDGRAAQPAGPAFDGQSGETRPSPAPPRARRGLVDDYV